MDSYAQAVLFDAPTGASQNRAWIPLCGYGGPYSLRRPTPGRPDRLELLTCTRPAGHGGDRHQYAELDRGVVAQWDRGGRPIWPPIV